MILTCSSSARSVGGRSCIPSRLTPDEQYTHISLWCLLSAPLLIGCDMTKFDDFTLNLLSNDEVLALDQDSLGKSATCVLTNGDMRVFEKELEDGGRALGFFNLGTAPANLDFNQFAAIGFSAKQDADNLWQRGKISEIIGAHHLSGKQHVRDVWRQSDLPDVDPTNGVLPMTIPAHGVMLYKLTAAR